MEKQPKHRVLITGGGTGGHVFPAIAIAKALQVIYDVDILFVGAKNRLEMQKVPAAGFPIYGLPIRGFQRTKLLKNIVLPYYIVQSLYKAYKIIRSWKPDVVVGVGGYASWPALFIASQLSIPIVLQEQNSYPGLVNRKFARKAKKICVAYEGMQRFFPADRIYLTGNPIRNELKDIVSKKTDAYIYFGLNEKIPVVLVVGGSLGARSINEAVAKIIEDLVNTKVQLIWQTGTLYYNEMLNRCGCYSGQGIYITDFIERMDLAYAAADVIVSRAGALAISELCVVGKPAILVPSPNVADDHQTKNAMMLKNLMAAEYVPDDQLQELLFPTIMSLLYDQQKRDRMQNELSRLAIHDADKRIAREIMDLLSHHQR